MSLLCCSATDRGCHLSSAPRTASISGDISVGRTGNAETTLATCTPLFRKIKDSDMFLTTMDTLLLLILSLVYACRTCNLVSPALKGVTMMWALSRMSALQYLGLEQSQSNILLYEDQLVQVFTHGELECCSPLFHRAITSCTWVLHYSAPLAQQMGCSDHSPRS